MTDSIKKQIFDRYFDGYVKEARQGAGAWAKLARKAEAGFIVAATCVTAIAVTAAVSVIAPAVMPAAMAINLGGLLVATGAVVATPFSLALRQTVKTAQDNLTRDINNGQLVARYKKDLIESEQRKLETASKVLPVLEQVSTLDDFKKVAAKRAEIVNDLTAQRKAVAQNAKMTHSMK